LAAQARTHQPGGDGMAKNSESIQDNLPPRGDRKDGSHA
jgi:hypothetical protein